MSSSHTLAEPRPSSRARLAASLLLALSAVWCVYWFVHAAGYLEDDAYIHLEFARSLAAGKGFAFNGRVVDGDTAPLWVFLLAAVHAVVPNWIDASKTLSVLGALFGCAGIYAYARSFGASLLPPELAEVFPAAILLLTVINPYSCYWLFSGMECFAAAGLACFAVLAASRSRPTPASLLLACLLAGIAPLVRPEMFFLSALLAVPLLAQWLRMPASPAKTLALAGGLVLLIAPLALWSIYSLHAFGHLLPNTNAAKRAGPTQSVPLRLVSIYSLGFPIIVAGLLAAAPCLAFKPSTVRRSLRGALSSAFEPASEAASPDAALPLSGWIFILWFLVATVFYIANRTYVQTRYILVPAPGLIVVVLALVLRSCRIAGRALYAAAFLWALAISLVIVRPFIRNRALLCVQTDKLAQFIRNRLPPDAPVAVYAIGQIAFVSQHPIVDIGGITRPDADPYLNIHGELMQWAKSQGALYNIDANQPDPGAVPVYTERFPYIGWTLRTSLYSTSANVSIWRFAPSQPAQPSPGQPATGR